MGSASLNKGKCVIDLDDNDIEITDASRPSRESRFIIHISVEKLTLRNRDCGP